MFTHVQSIQGFKLCLMCEIRIDELCYLYESKIPCLLRKRSSNICTQKTVYSRGCEYLSCVNPEFRERLPCEHKAGTEYVDSQREV